MNAKRVLISKGIEKQVTLIPHASKIKISNYTDGDLYINLDETASNGDGSVRIPSYTWQIVSKDWSKREPAETISLLGDESGEIEVVGLE